MRTRIRLPKKHLRRGEQEAKVRKQENINIYALKGEDTTEQLSFHSMFKRNTEAKIPVVAFRIYKRGGF